MTDARDVMTETEILNTVCILVATFAPTKMIGGFARYDTSKRITTIVGVFPSFDEYMETMKHTSAEKIEKYARCKLNVENKRLPFVYGYEGSSPQLIHANQFRTIPYRVHWSKYFDKEWDFNKDPEIRLTDVNLEIL